MVKRVENFESNTTLHAYTLSETNYNRINIIKIRVINYVDLLVTPRRAYSR